MEYLTVESVDWDAHVLVFPMSETNVNLVKTAMNAIADNKALRSATVEFLDPEIRIYREDGVDITSGHPLYVEIFHNNTAYLTDPLDYNEREEFEINLEAFK